MIFFEFYLLILTLFSSSPFAIRIMTLPSPALPVRPSRCTILTGDAKQSYDMIRLMSPMSSPSSATLVAISVFKTPFLRSWTTYF